MFEKRSFLSIFSRLNISDIVSGVYVKVLAHEPKIVAVVIEFQVVSLTSRRPYLCPSE